MCAWLKGEDGLVGMSSLSGIYSVHLLGVAYCLAWAQLTDACYSTSVNKPSQVYRFSRRQRDWHLDASVVWTVTFSALTLFIGNRSLICNSLTSASIACILMVALQVNRVQRFPSVLFIHMTQNSTSENRFTGFYTIDGPSSHPTNGVKSAKGNKSTDHNDGESPTNIILSSSITGLLRVGALLPLHQFSDASTHPLQQSQDFSWRPLDNLSYPVVTTES